MGIVTTCRRCRAQFAPDRRAIAAGAWRLCPGCRGDAATRPDAPDPSAGRCGQCGRPLNAGKRTVCGRCLGVAS